MLILACLCNSISHSNVSDLTVTYTLQENNTALIVAAKNGHKPVVEKLMEQGANMDHKNAVSVY